MAKEFIAMPANLSHKGLATFFRRFNFLKLLGSGLSGLGDRFEIFSAAAAAMIARIPIAHLHGGEATEGLIDEPIRHYTLRELLPKHQLIVI